MASAEDRVGHLEASVAQLAVAVQDIQSNIAELAKVVADSVQLTGGEASGVDGRHRPQQQGRRDGRDADAMGGERGGRRGFPHAPRYDLPLFDGSEDPLLWLRQCEQYGRLHDIPREEWVQMAGMHLRGEAQEVLDNWETGDQFISWPEFYDTFLQRFTRHSTSGPLGDLANLKQHNSRADVYAREFQRLLARTPRLSRQDQIELFTAGLSSTLAAEVRRDRPRDLADAMGLAREAERREDLFLAKVAQATRSRGSRSTSWASGTDPSASNRATAPSSSALPVAPGGSKLEGGRALTTASQTSGTVPTAPPYCRRLSPAEMSDRREKGLCYNCDEVYSRGHRCQRLFHLEVLSEGEEDDSLEEEPTLSAIAMKGLKASRTMQVIVVMGGQRLVGLVDSGSTHNFISSYAASVVQITQSSGTGQQVQVANGARLPCLGRLKDVQFCIQTHIFSDSFLVIPLEGFDVVLGVQWL